jgi:3-oxoadipate CoA-transferase alpha subunit
VINKQYASVAEAVADIPDGATVMVGGFGASGSPIELLHALIDHGATDLTVINNNTGNGEVGLAALIGNGQVSKMICSFPRSSQSKVFPELYRAGKVALEIVPQGTLAERIRAAGAASPPSIRQRRLAPCWQRERRFANSMDDHTSWSRGSRQTSR